MIFRTNCVSQAASRLQSLYKYEQNQLDQHGFNLFLSVIVFRSYNFEADPTAASFVFEKFETPKVLITSEMTRSMALSMDFIRTMFRQASNPENFKARLFYDVSQFFIGNKSKHWALKADRSFVSPDAVCMACVLDDLVIIDRKRVFGYVVPFGSNAAGHLTLDGERRKKQRWNVEIVTRMDRNKFKQLFFQICLPSKAPYKYTTMRSYRKRYYAN